MRENFRGISFTIMIVAVVMMLVACSSSESTSKEKTSLSDNYPNKVIEVLVGYSSGGGTDVSARKMIEALNKSSLVDQSFIVNNLPGAGGSFALRELGTKRKSDEYSLVFEAAYAPSLWNEGVGKLTLSDYKPIAQVASDYAILTVRNDSKYQTMDELVEVLKKDPESIVISLGSPLTGDDAWMWNNIKNALGIDGKLTTVAHEGTNPAFNMLLAGDADVVALTPNLAKDHLEKGTLKALAVTTDERIKQFKEVPTLKEVGVDVTYYRPRGVLMGGGVSEEVALYWEKKLEKMVETDVWKEYIQSFDLLPEFKGSKEYYEYIKKEGDLYKKYYETVK